MQHIHILYKYSERQNLYISIEYCIRNCNFDFNTLSQLLFYNVPYISSSKLILVASIYNISTLRAEASRIQVQDQLELYDETCFKRRKPDNQISRRQTYMERIQNVPHNIALSLSNTQMHRRFNCFTYKHFFSWLSSSQLYVICAFLFICCRQYSIFSLFFMSWQIISFRYPVAWMA